MSCTENTNFFGGNTSFMGGEQKKNFLKRIISVFLCFFSNVTLVLSKLRRPLAVTTSFQTERQRRMATAVA